MYAVGLEGRTFEIDFWYFDIAAGPLACLKDKYFDTFGYLNLFGIWIFHPYLAPALLRC
jgi:hypothetical protein